MGTSFFWEESVTTTKGLNPNKVTGVKLGTIFMLAGFIWLIITMIMLLLIGTGTTQVQYAPTKIV